MKAAVKEKLGGVPLTPRHEVTSGGQDHQHDVHKIHVHELHMMIMCTYNIRHFFKWAFVMQYLEYVQYTYGMAHMAILETSFFKAKWVHL